MLYGLVGDALDVPLTLMVIAAVVLLTLPNHAGFATCTGLRNGILIVTGLMIVVYSTSSRS